MKRFWISWIEGSEDYRPVTFPPNAAIIGWWSTGFCESGSTICAVVEARNESEARDAVLKDWPEALEVADWRFFEPKESDWAPGNSRFPKSDWMIERFSKKDTPNETNGKNPVQA